MLDWLRRTLTKQVADEARETEERLSQRLLLIERRLAEAEQVLLRHGLQIARVEGRTSIPRPGGAAPSGGDHANGSAIGPA